MFLIPFHPTSSTVRLWGAHWDGQPPPPTKLGVSSEDGAFSWEATVNHWEVLGTNGSAPNFDQVDQTKPQSVVDGLTQVDDDPKGTISWKRCYFAWYDVDGLPAGQRFTVRAHAVLDYDTVYAKAFFETAPATLPENGRPYTLLLGSCYDRTQDAPLIVDLPDNPLQPEYPPSAVAQSFATLPAEYEPHVKAFVGDQVYLDQPPLDFFWLNRPKAEVRGRINHFYRDSWRRLKPMLEAGANVMLSDDHDYWNDYPYEPLMAWRDLQNDKYRAHMGAATRTWVDKVQNVKPWHQINIGTDLSMFFADTRRNRSLNNKRFMRTADFNVLRDWISGLRCPGVLALSGAVFWPPFGLFPADPDAVAAAGGAIVGGILAGPGGAQLGAAAGWVVNELFGPDDIITDHNQTSFGQFALLAAALCRANHDILVLSGDVHFGRLSSVRSNRDNGSDPTRIFEVLSSPMANLATSRERPADPIPRTFPPQVSATIMSRFGVRHNVIRYRKVVPERDDDPNGTKEHFVTLGFSKPAEAGDGVFVDVDVWLVKETVPPDPPPRLPWGRIHLDGGRLPRDGSVPVRLVTHVIRAGGPGKPGGKPRPIAALANPGEPWSPRRSVEAIRDIELGLAQYETAPEEGQRRPVGVVDRDGRKYLRTDPDVLDVNNLGDLPNVEDPGHIYD